MCFERRRRRRGSGPYHWRCPRGESRSSTGDRMRVAAGASPGQNGAHSVKKSVLQHKIKSKQFNSLANNPKPSASIIYSRRSPPPNSPSIMSHIPRGSVQSFPNYMLEELPQQMVSASFNVSSRPLIDQLRLRLRLRLIPGARNWLDRFRWRAPLACLTHAPPATTMAVVNKRFSSALISLSRMHLRRRQ